MDASDIRPDEFYVIQGSDLLKLVKVAKRLYTESRMYGDEMRDNAQIIYEGVIPNVEGPIDL